MIYDFRFMILNSTFYILNYTDIAPFICGCAEKLKVNLNIEYVAMEIPNDFIVGYGLDYDGFGRNYPDIYTVVD